MSSILDPGVAVLLTIRTTNVKDVNTSCGNSYFYYSDIEEKLIDVEPYIYIGEQQAKTQGDQMGRRELPNRSYSRYETKPQGVEQGQATHREPGINFKT